MATSNSTLLFIPDISGFTNFVNTTEIKHSRHIISELLEIIMNCDDLNMKVSEIEGDAVLYYKDSIPTLEELITQCELTFKKFHSHLKRYDTERICRCGACETASNLSLKFIIHAGEVEKIKIRDHEKLHGADVIIAHRLMKNSINSSEYILFSEKVKIPDEKSHSNWISISTGSDNYKNLGEVKYSFIPLEKLHNQIAELPSIRFPELSKEKICIQQKINAPINLVYENYTNFEKRLTWNEEIKDIILYGKKLNQAGELHTCLIGNNKLDIEAMGRLEDKDKIIYGERLNKLKILRDVINICTFEKNDNQTILKVEIDFKINSFFAPILKLIVRKILYKQTLHSLQKLKIASEAEH